MSLMFGFIFILGRTRSQWNGWPSGNLSARHAIMNTGKGKFGTYNSENRAVVVKQRDDSVLFFGETLDSKLRKPGKMLRSKM